MNLRTFHIRLDKYLIIDQNRINDFMETVEVLKTDSQLIVAENNYWSILVYYNQKNENKENSNSEHFVKENQSSFNFKNSGNSLVEKIVHEENQLQKDEQILYDSLKDWRKEIAINKKLKSYMICHDSTLKRIAKSKPKYVSELLEINGIGQRKIDHFGEEILQIIHSHQNQFKS